MLRYWFSITTLALIALIIHGDVIAQDRNFKNNPFSPHVLKKSHSTPSFYIMVSDTAGFRLWLNKNISGAVLQTRAANIYSVSKLSDHDAKKLFEAPQLQFVETTERYASPENENSNIDLSVNAVTTVHHLYPYLTGEGLKISIKENAFNKHDIDFAGRIHEEASIPDISDNHATSMATIISGAGNSSPKGKGTAWKSILAFSDFKDLLPDTTSAVMAAGISVQNHSYGVGVENYYGIESYAFDKQCVKYPEIVHIFSVGNSGVNSDDSGPYSGLAGYANLTGQFKASKNTISVGGINHKNEIEPLSSRGPAYDGRVKPELVAFGDGGTSEAAAIVSGISLLAQEAYKNQKGGLPPATLIKAALINSADDLGNPQVDYEYGFGSADALGTIQTIIDERYFFGSIQQGQEALYPIKIPANVYRLKISLVWNDPEANPGNTRALINDLDLELNAAGSTYKPWVLSAFPQIDSLKKNARRIDDHTNNVEQITVNKPNEGVYQIKIIGFDIPEGLQSFSVVYETEKGFQWMYPMGSDAMEADKDIFMRWSWNHPDEMARAEWTISGMDQWSFIGDVNLSTGFFQWPTPDLNEIIQLRFVLAGQELKSEPFVVSRELTLQTGFNCENDALIFWNDESLQEYRLYKLKKNFLQEATSTIDTVFAINKHQEHARYFAVAPLIRGKPGPRSRSINYENGQEECYVKSFLARNIVTDSVLLDLQLGTNIGLESVSLERKSGQGFIELQTISPVLMNSYSFFDLHPMVDKNHYRIRLVRENQEMIYSYANFNY